ncbi:hypothetical protein Hanom_Chr14g01302741 [Helianthus anomalus]
MSPCKSGYWYQILYRPSKSFFILCFISYFGIYSTRIDFTYMVLVSYWYSYQFYLFGGARTILDHSHSCHQILCVLFLKYKEYIKSGCEWREQKMLLFISIFRGKLFTPCNFLIYFESVCEWRREKS